MAPLFPPLPAKPVLPLTLKNGQWVIAQTPAIKTKNVQVQPMAQATPAISAKEALPWVGLVGGVTGLATFAYGFPKAIKELKLLKYKQILEGGDQQPLDFLKAATDRSKALEGQIVNLDTPEVDLESTKVNNAVNAMFLEGKLGTSQGQRVLANKGYRLEKLDITGWKLKTAFPLRNKLKALALGWWFRDQEKISRELTQKRLTQPSQAARWWFELFNPANKKAQLRGMSFDDSRLHNNEFQLANLAETTHNHTRQYQNNYNRTDLTNSVKDGMVSYFNDYSHAKAQGMSAHNAEFAGLTANYLDASPSVDPLDHNNSKAANFKGIKIKKQGVLKNPDMPFSALSTMKHSNLTRSDWQGAEVEGLDTTGSKMTHVNLQDTIWRGTTHNNQDLTKTTLAAQKGRFIRFLPSKVGPFRTRKGHKDGKEFCTFNKSNLAYKNLSGVEITGIRFKNTNLTSTFLANSIIDGVTIHDIVTQPEKYKKQLKLLFDILKDCHIEKQSFPILTRDSFVKLKNLSNADNLSKAEKFISSIQKTASLRKQVYKNAKRQAELGDI
jgi:uncharacterized protein YjbI with pentapeptide repeats